MAGAGVPLATIQKLMGHSDIKMRYITTTNAQLDDAIALTFGRLGIGQTLANGAAM